MVTAESGRLVAANARTMPRARGACCVAAAVERFKRRLLTSAATLDRSPAADKLRAITQAEARGFGRPRSTIVRTAFGAGYDPWVSCIFRKNFWVCSPPVL